MAKIELKGGFFPIPEGTHIFKIVGVDYNENFGKLEIKMKIAQGQTHSEHFQLIKDDNSPNEKTIAAFSYFAKTATQNYMDRNIDPEELIGCFIECDVEHDSQPSNKNPNKNVTFVRLTNKRPADGYTEEVSSPAPASKKAAPAAAAKKTEVKSSGNIDLDALLG